MKRLKKLIKRLFLLTVVVIVIAGCVLAGSGYKMYRDALNHQGLESKVAEIQSKTLRYLWDKKPLLAP